ncbi:MAG: peroxiredoxin [Patescibacteria group bacterium]|nr:peroxiredoxin [Patescibacteria group bacterium]
MPKTNLLEVGDRAPLFTLLNQDGKKIRLTDYKDKKNIVLIFYPGDMTPGCTMQLCAVRDDWSKFELKNTEVFGVNHGDAASHKTFVKKYTFPFPLLIDKDKKVSEKYGALKRLFKAKIIKRSVVVVGKDGKILFIKNGMPKNSDILKVL